jgi:hypothetical protein
MDSTVKAINDAVAKQPYFAGRCRAVIVGPNNEITLTIRAPKQTGHGFDMVGIWYITDAGLVKPVRDESWLEPEGN